MGFWKRMGIATFIFLCVTALIVWGATRDYGDDSGKITSTPVVSTNDTHMFTINPFTNSDRDQSFVDWTNVDNVEIISDIFSASSPFSVASSGDSGRGNRFLKIGTTSKELTGVIKIGFEGIFNIDDNYADTLNLGIYVGDTETSSAHVKRIPYIVLETAPPKLTFDGTLTEYDTLNTIPPGTDVYISIEDPNNRNITFLSTSTDSIITINVTP